jgi:hypothetical protein
MTLHLHGDDPDDEPYEPMTGWDDEEPDALTNPTHSAGRSFLLALSNYMDFHQITNRDASSVSNAFTELQNVLKLVDWDAVDFAVQALESGQELFSCFPGNDVLTKYKPNTPPDETYPF